MCQEYVCTISVKSRQEQTNKRENMRIYRLSEDGGSLPVFFKLPISEISEIDDHKSVRIFIFLK